MSNLSFRLNRLRSSGLIVGLLNMGMRGLGLISRFGLMVYLARLGALETIGSFGLVYAVTAMTPAVLSFGLHYRMNRLMVGEPSIEIGHRLRDRLILHLLVFLPLAVSVLWFWFIWEPQHSVPFSGLATCAGVCFGELILNEIHLTLITIQKPFIANVVYFFRSAIWVPPFIVISYIIPDERNLQGILSWWIAGQLSAFGIFIFALRSWPWKAILKCPLNIGWLLLDPTKSAVIYLSDMGMTCGVFVDRFVMSGFLDIRDIGIYTFYWSIANGFQQLVFAAVVQAAFPALVAAARSDDRGRSLRHQLEGELRKTIFASIGLGSVLYISKPLLDVIMGRTILAVHQALFLTLLIGMTIRLIADLMHYGLYARGHDTQLALINMCSAPMATGFSAAALTFFGLSGVGFAVIASACSLLVLRVYVLRRDLLS